MDYVFKMVVVGDSAVGKSQLLSRFSNNEFKADGRATVGVEFQTKTILIDKRLVKAQIWDTAGQERYRSVTAAYYRGAHGALVVYDVTKADSFEHVPRWLEQLRGHAAPGAVIMLAGNKCDLGPTTRAVAVESGRELAEREGLLFLETSALDGTNVENAFLMALEKMYRSVSRRKSLEMGCEEPPLVLKPSLKGTRLDVAESRQAYRCCTE